MDTAESNSALTRRRLPFFALAGVGILVLGAGWVMWQSWLAAQLDRDVEKIESRRAQVYFSDEIDDLGEIIETPIERNWIAHWSRTPININFHKVEQVRECLEIAKGFHGLWQMDLSQSDIADADMSVLGEMTQLRHLFLHDTELGDAVLEATSKLPNLETLDLSRSKITAAGLAKWHPPKKLKTLMLIECDIGEGSLNGLKDHAELEILRLCDTKTVSSNLINLGQLPKLDEIDLSGTLVDGSCIPWIAKQYQLSTLRLADSKLSAEDVIEVGRQFVKLREISLERLPITDKAIRLLSHGRRLNTLDLSGTEFIDEMTPNMFGKTSMIALQDLEIDGTQVTAEGIVRLVEQTRLTRLVISEKLLSDSDRQYIASKRKELELIEIPVAKTP